MTTGSAQLMATMGLAMLAAQLHRRYAARSRLRRAAAELEPLGSELGLDYYPPAYLHGLGALRGRYRGRQLNIDPEARAIVLRFEGSPRVALTTYAVDTPAAHDMVSAQCRDRAFDAVWKTRRAAPDLAEALAEGRPAERAIALEPSFQLAKNNLAWSRQQQQKASQSHASR